MDRDVLDGKGTKLSYFDPYCDILTTYKEEDEESKTPTYFDQEFYCKWTRKNISHAYKNDSESSQLKCKIGRAEKDVATKSKFFRTNDLYILMCFMTLKPGSCVGKWIWDH